MNHWVAVQTNNTIVALQHFCGVHGRAVNCLISQRGNWECPESRTTTYGAPVEFLLGDTTSTMFVPRPKTRTKNNGRP